jgi:hypothetical protein
VLTNRIVYLRALEAHDSNHFLTVKAPKELDFVLDSKLPRSQHRGGNSDRVKRTVQSHSRLLASISGSDIKGEAFG